MIRKEYVIVTVVVKDIVADVDVLRAINKDASTAVQRPIASRRHLKTLHIRIT